MFYYFHTFLHNLIPRNQEKKKVLEARLDYFLQWLAAWLQRPLRSFYLLWEQSSGKPNNIENFVAKRTCTPYLSVFSPKVGKYGSEKLRIWTLHAVTVIQETTKASSFPARTWIWVGSLLFREYICEGSIAIICTPLKKRLLKT